MLQVTFVSEYFDFLSQCTNYSVYILDVKRCWNPISIFSTQIRARIHHILAVTFRPVR